MTIYQRKGQLALEYSNKRLPIVVMKSHNGFYIGTHDDEGPVSRESLEYWPTEQMAQNALDSKDWTQRETP